MAAKRAGVQRNIEAEAWIFPTHQSGYNREMRSAADR